MRIYTIKSLYKRNKNVAWDDLRCHNPKPDKCSFKKERTLLNRLIRRKFKQEKLDNEINA